MQRLFTVGVLTKMIRNQLQDLGPLRVVGELTQVRQVQSGHCYFTLKDDQAVLSGVMWRATALRHGPLPAEGSKVEVHGSLDVYDQRGTYQIIATRIVPLGMGDLLVKLEALKSRLAAEGLFADDTKRPLPFVPKAVGLATAAGSAALADMLDSIHTRFPGMRVIHAPCLVQGAGAGPSIVRALEHLGRHPDVEVIICGRGGGSLEDLWAFNEEIVVRAIASSPVPVISAVGHETDTTLADLAADLRAKTPTEAGELVVPVKAELLERLSDLRLDLDQAIDQRLETAQNHLKALSQHRALSALSHALSRQGQRLDELRLRMDHHLDERLHVLRARLADSMQTLTRHSPQARLERERARLATFADRLPRTLEQRRQHSESKLALFAARLDALSPLKTLARGYSVATHSDGKIITNAKQALPGTLINLRLAQGELRTRVEGHTLSL